MSQSATRAPSATIRLRHFAAEAGRAAGDDGRPAVEASEQVHASFILANATTSLALLAQLLDAERHHVARLQEPRSASCPMPTPGGVPVVIMSPGISVMHSLR